ncbi:unnamed protein product, partial [Rotaria sp. Silwood1]
MDCKVQIKYIEKVILNISGMSPYTLGIQYICITNTTVTGPHPMIYNDEKTTN